jgi:hypothetical protein
MGKNARGKGSGRSREELLYPLDMCGTTYLYCLVHLAKPPKSQLDWDMTVLAKLPVSSVDGTVARMALNGFHSGVSRQAAMDHAPPGAARKTAKGFASLLSAAACIIEDKEKDESGSSYETFFTGMTIRLSLDVIKALERHCAT